MSTHTTARHLLLAALASTAALQTFGAPAQAPLSLPDESAAGEADAWWKPVEPARSLRGRFLHVTDLHPDPYYVAGVSTKHACHRKDSKGKKHHRSAAYGTPLTGCDSPLQLVNETLAYIAREWADEIDFVVWTGDSARHDNDRKHPRTPKEIYDLNRLVARQMQDAFTRKGIPVIPSLGNNDIWPHNILAPGPNDITNQYSTIWRPFMYSHSYQTFQRGAYFSVEVVPDALAVISLNTLYFYDSNKAVGGCEWNDRNDAGNLEFDWLEVQLSLFRSRGMYVYLTGHVPPSPGNYFPECHVRYTELALRFQDIILGHLYGHMNVDHFFFLEAIDLELPAIGAAQGPQPHTTREDLYETLIHDFGELPGKKKVNEDQFAVVNVNPSVVPNPYVPAFRIYSYNATGAADYNGTQARINKDRKHGHPRGPKVDKKRCKDAPWRDTWRCHLTEKWHSDSESPVRMNRLWTPLGFAQYFFPRVNATKASKLPKFKLEYTTFAPGALSPPTAGNGTRDETADEFIYPIPPAQLPRSLLDDVSISGKGEGGGGKKKGTKEAPYRMADLTIGSWLKLARRLGDEKEEKLRGRFRTYMTVGVRTEEVKG